MLIHRNLNKLQSTYVEKLAGLVHPKTGRVHTSFNQTVTATGRLSSSNPNLQNIPIRTVEGQLNRQAFIPEDVLLLLVGVYYSFFIRFDDMTGKSVFTDFWSTPKHLFQFQCLFGVWGNGGKL